MASASAIRAGRAVVEIFADDSKLMRGLARSKNQLNKFAASAGRMGGAIFGGGVALAAPFVAATKTFMTQGDRIGKMAARTGMDVEALSEIDFATSQSGSTLEDFEKGLRRLQTTIGDTSANTEVFKQYGIDIAALDGLSPEEQFLGMADALAGISDPTKRAAAAYRLFGRAGTQLLPMLSQGAAGVEAMKKKARDLGLTMSSEDVAAAERLTDATDIVGRTMKRAAVSVGAALAPALEKLAGWIGEATSAAAIWIDNNRPLIMGAAAIAGGLMLAGGSILAVAGIAKVGATGIGLFTGAMKLAGLAIGVLTSPTTLAIGAIVGVGAAALWATGQTETAKDAIGAAWDTAAKDAGTAFDGIKAALASGDLGAAAGIAGAYIELAFSRVSASLGEIWEGVKLVFFNIVDGMAGYWMKFVQQLEEIWQGLTSAFGEAQGGLATEIARRVYGEDAAAESEAMNRQRRQQNNNSKAAMRQRHADERRAMAEQTAAGSTARTEAAGKRMAEAQKKRIEAEKRLAALSQKAQDKARQNTEANAEANADDDKYDTARARFETTFAGITGTSKTGVASRMSLGAVRMAQPEQTNPVPHLENITGKLDELKNAVEESAPVYQ